MRKTINSQPGLYTRCRELLCNYCIECSESLWPACRQFYHRQSTVTLRSSIMSLCNLLHCSSESLWMHACLCVSLPEHSTTPDSIVNLCIPTALRVQSHSGLILCNCIISVPHTPDLVNYYATYCIAAQNRSGLHFCTFIIFRPLSHTSI